MTENLPTVVKDDDTSEIDAASSAYLRADSVIKAINAALPPGSKTLVPIPTEYVFKKRDREIVSAAFHAVFWMMGGASGFHRWAEENQTDFYKLYSRLLPSDTETPVSSFNFQFVSAVPETKQDRVTIDETGKVIDAEVLPE